jgi:hypothetical protein
MDGREASPHPTDPDRIRVTEATAVCPVETGPVQITAYRPCHRAATPPSVLRMSHDRIIHEVPSPATLPAADEGLALTPADPAGPR